MTHRLFSTLAALLFGLVALGAAPTSANDAEGGYLLVLSWSPTHCLADGHDDARQCGPDRPRPYAFVVHGLWPQAIAGPDHPAYCERPAPWVAEPVIAEALEIMPSRRLVLHQWRKHGTCTGLSPQAYFQAVAQAFARIDVPGTFDAPTDPVTTSPAALREAFLRANPDLPAGAITLDCGNRRGRARLREVRVCLDRDLAPRACRPSERASCRAETLVLPPAR